MGTRVAARLHGEDREGDGDGATRHSLLPLSGLDAMVLGKNERLHAARRTDASMLDWLLRSNEGSDASLALAAVLAGAAGLGALCKEQEGSMNKVVGDPEGAGTVAVHVAELKAVFFVKDFAGNPEYRERLEPGTLHPALGRRIKVVFNDGEVVEGTTTGYQPTRPGFFVEPADPGSNNERCYVVAAATREVSLL